MVPKQTRRGALSIVGATGVTLVAGCLSGADDAEGAGNGNGNGDGNGADDDTGADDTVDETDEHGEMDETGSVRVAHLSPDAPNVDVWVDSDPVLEDVPYRAVSEYLELPVGPAAVMITAAGDEDTVVFDEELEIGEGDYTIAALGELAEENEPFDAAVLEDDLSDPGEEARIRAVHASPDAPAVDITAADGEVVLFEDVEFGEAGAAYVDPDDYTLEIRPATEDNDGDVVATFDVAPEAGNVYSAFAVGYLEPEAAPAEEAFDLEVVVDAAADEEEADGYEGEDDDHDDSSDY